MTRLLVQLKTSDFSQWKKGFETGAEMRSSFGALSDQVFQDASDPSQATVLLEWESMEQARRFVDSHELSEAMEKSGVAGKPSFTFLNEL
jgi:heme-degrading monooxygenase HmoA